jgi:hypothetical protein
LERSRPTRSSCVRGAVFDAPLSVNDEGVEHSIKSYGPLPRIAIRARDLVTNCEFRLSRGRASIHEIVPGRGLHALTDIRCPMLWAHARWCVRSSEGQVSSWRRHRIGTDPTDVHLRTGSTSRLPLSHSRRDAEAKPL